MKVSTGARMARKHRWTAEQIEIMKYCKKYRSHPGGTFLRWGHVFCPYWRTSNGRTVHLTQMVSVHHERPVVAEMMILPWIFDTDKFDMELIRAMSAMTDNFKDFPGLWHQLLHNVQHSDNYQFGIVMARSDRGSVAARVKIMWKQAAGADPRQPFQPSQLDNFRNSLEPYRIRAAGNTNRPSNNSGEHWLT